MRRGKFLVILVTLILVGLGGFFLFRAIVSSSSGLVGAAWGHAHSKIRLGVVDFEKLLQKHPDWKKLEDIDREILGLEQEMSKAPAFLEKLTREHAQRMEDAHRKAREELEQELKFVNEEMKKMKDALQAELGSKRDKINEELKKLQEEYQKKIDHIRGPGGEAKSPAAKQMQSFAQDLIALRDRQIAARKIELDKQAQEKLMAEKAKMDEELSKFELQISKENQKKKLNLQLKLQVAKTQEEYNKVEEELAALADEESKKKEEKKAEFTARLEELKSQYEKENAKAIKEFQKKLDEDVKTQLGAEERKILGSIVKPGEVPADFKKRRNELTAEFEKRKKELEAKLKEKNQASLARLESKKQELEASLKVMQKNLAEEMTKRQKALGGAEQERRIKEMEILDKLQKRRENLYRSMVADLKERVSMVAEKQKVPIVIGGFIVNIDCTDLTEPALIAVEEMK